MFVRRPTKWPGFEVKQTGDRVVRGESTAAEVAPRMVSLAKQLQPQQALQVTGLPAARADTVRSEVLEALGAGYAWSAAGGGAAEVVTVTITRSPIPN